MVVCSAILYYAASINVFKVYLHIMKEYGWPFGKCLRKNQYLIVSISAFQQAFIVFTLFCSIAVACGFDWTFGFLWLKGETGLEWMKDLEKVNLPSMNLTEVNLTGMNLTATLANTTVSGAGAN